MQRLRPEDVGYDSQGVPPDSPQTKRENNTSSDGIDGDPLVGTYYFFAFPLFFLPSSQLWINNQVRKGDTVDQRATRFQS